MSLVERTREWRAQRRAARRRETAALVAGWGGGVAGLVALADRALGLPQSARLALFAAGAAALARLAWTRLRPAAPSRETEEIFAAASRVWPESRPMLASAWALREAGPDPRASEALRAGHISRADTLAAELPATALFRWEPSRAARRGGALAAAVLVLNTAFGDAASWTRVLAPWREPELERYVALEPGDAEVEWGGAARVVARRLPEGRSAGLRPSDLILETRAAGRWRAAPWDRVEEDTARFEAGALSAPLEHRLRWRDLTGRTRTLVPVAPPRLGALKAVVRGPRASRSFELSAEPEVRARRGDWVTVSGAEEAPLAGVELCLSGVPVPLALKRGAGGSWSASFLAANDATFSLEASAPSGRRDSAPASYALKVEADAAPIVELLSPTVPLRASASDSIPIAYAARDDGALTRLELVASFDGRETRRPLPHSGGEVAGDAVLSLRGAGVGKLVEFWLEAVDDASPAQTARSAKGAVELVDFEAAHEAALRAGVEVDAALQSAAARAEAAAGAERAGDEARAKEEAAAAAREWAAAQSALDAWNAALAADARANPGLAEQAQRAAAETRRAGEQGLPRAAAALAARDLPRAAREHDALAAQARGARRALREASRVQAAQDMAEGAASAEREASETASALESLQAKARAGEVSAKDMAEFDAAVARVAAAVDALVQALAALPRADPESPMDQARALPLGDARETAQRLRSALARGDAAGAAQAARELAQKLEALSRALNEAGRREAGERGQRAQEGSGRVKRAWQAAVEAQQSAADAARGADAAREKERLAAQKRLLAELAREQEALLAAPAPAWPPAARAAAEDALRQFRSGSVTDAERRLRAAAGQLRVESVSRRQDAAALEAASKAEDALAARLEAGVPAGAPDPAKTGAAAEVQSSARETASSLRSEITAATNGFGMLAGRTLARVDEALTEQRAAESALRAGDSAEGLKRAEAALAALQDGQGDSDGASGGSEGPAGGFSEPFGSSPGGTVRSAPAGATGARMGRVRLPRADEYRPPRSLREELQRSLSEPRPAAEDSSVKEYFRRLSR